MPAIVDQEIDLDTPFTEGFSPGIGYNSTGNMGGISITDNP